MVLNESLRGLQGYVKIFNFLVGGRVLK